LIFKEAITTKKVRYLGDYAVDIPALSVHVEPGDVIEVPDDFVNGQFEEVVVAKKSTKGDE
jgi:hypothetical protein